MLLDVAGKPLILHTLEQAKKAANVSRVIVATDDKRIFDVVEQSGNSAVLTSGEHASGSDRIAEVAATLPEGSIVVNVQGDEPLISPKTIEKAVDALLNDPAANISTVWEAIRTVEDLLSPDVVKVVVNSEDDALYFSRSPIPFPRDAVKKFGNFRNALEQMPELLSNFRKHVGLYVYRREYLLSYTQMPQTTLEKIEMLEQLRALENGARIKVVEAEGESIGVDTQDDLDRISEIIRRQRYKSEVRKSEIINLESGIGIWNGNWNLESRI